MTTAERRLEGLTQKLTARERAILVMQRWLREEEFDKKLRDQKPPEQEAEYDWIVEAVEDANQQIGSQLVIEQLWLFEDEIRLGWLESFAAMTRRVEHLEAELQKRGAKLKRGGAAAKRESARGDTVLLEPLPPVEHGLEWTMRILWGKRTNDDDPPPDPEKLVSALAAAVKLGRQTRAKDLAAWRVVLTEMDHAFDGYNAKHIRVERDLSALEEQVAKLHAAAQPFIRFELSEPDEERINVAREYVCLDDIRGVPASKNEGQRWESDYAKKQREEANAAWRKELDSERAKREAGGEDSDVFTPGGKE